MRHDLIPGALFPDYQLPARSLTLDHSYSRGVWILHANYGYAYNGNATPPAAPGFDPVSLGFPASMRSGLQVANFPAINVGTNLAGLGRATSSVFYAKYLECAEAGTGKLPSQVERLVWADVLP